MAKKQSDTPGTNKTLEIAPVDEASQPFIGRWNRLVSQTNWEKGRIIYQWREALTASAAAASEYSDEAWSRRVGGVTGQHAGRLRRVYQRFGSVYDQYSGLYWSHFHAALEWNDAEMWLEGAVQSNWSVSRMRRQRWETLGEVESAEPGPDQDVGEELDEDFEPAVNQLPVSATVDGSVADVRQPSRKAAAAADADLESESRPRRRDEAPDKRAGERKTKGEIDSAEPSPVPLAQPFANLPDLPDDLADAFESLKLVVLRHKAGGWQEISRDDLLRWVGALEQLILAPSAVQTPF